MPVFKKTFTLKHLMICLMMLSSLGTAYSQAAMVSTSDMIISEGVSYNATDLKTALASEELKQQLQDLGVDPAELNDRIASLTPSEIQQLNMELAEQPAGSGVLGILLTVFIVFILTDMLCATDIFSFVNCINH